MENKKNQALTSFFCPNKEIRLVNSRKRICKTNQDSIISHTRQNSKKFNLTSKYFSILKMGQLKLSRRYSRGSHFINSSGFFLCWSSFKIKNGLGTCQADMLYGLKKLYSIGLPISVLLYWLFRDLPISPFLWFTIFLPFYRF